MWKNPKNWWKIWFFRKDVTDDNIKSQESLHPFSEKHIFRKTPGGFKLTPSCFRVKGIFNRVFFGTHHLNSWGVYYNFILSSIPQLKNCCYTWLYLESLLVFEMLLINDVLHQAILEQFLQNQEIAKSENLFRNILL